jgi:DNA-binding winged helix-turn-helix (wHTH) protein
VNPVPVAFGDCLFDPTARRLSRRGKPVELSPKAYALLAFLVERRPAALSQAELRDRLWPDSAVAYTSLPRIVTELRKAIGDDRNLLRTVRGFGYAFAGEPAEPTPELGCALSWSGHDVPLLPGDNLIGRGLDCRLRISSSLVSRHHARIRLQGDGATIEDLGSKNGTAVNARYLDSPRALADGDKITIGSAIVIFRAASAQSSTNTAREP